MSTDLFARHRALLERAVQALDARSHWSPYPESPSPKAYGEEAAAQGRAAFQAYLGQDFPLHQPGQTGLHGGERSPWGVPLDVRYPVCDPEQLVAAAQAAMPAWQRLGPDGRAGILAEALQRLNQRSFEIAQAVMMTSGQAWMMAFQAGGPHAQDRGLEALAGAWRAQSAVQREALWEKPQGKGEPLRMAKRFEPVGRGVALVIGCATFPTWNTYPGLFAALATGNPVLLKPHRDAILPAAITVAVLREVLTEQGVDPNVAMLAVAPLRNATQALATHPGVRSIDYTGGTTFGQWLIDNARQAQVYAELAGVNNVVIESTDAYRAMLKNMAFTVSLYSGQMCTTTQAFIVPAGGIGTDEGHKSYEDVCADFAQAIDTLLADAKTAHALLGAIQSEDTVRRVAEAPRLGTVVRPSQRLPHPEFEAARVQTPLLLACDARDEAAYMEERFGPISFIVRADDADAAIALSKRIALDHGALTAGVYSTRPEFIDAMVEASWDAKVALSINLTSSVFVNQSSAFSDFHATGGNPASNASYTDAAFVANRFRVVQRRWQV